VARRLKVLALTGGIGSGKSTVGQMIADRGVPVLDADQLAREIVEPGRPAHADVAAAWPEVIAADGRIDRKRLGNIVFGDAKARRHLEAITHPRIAALAEERLGELARAGHRLAVYEASLLVESGRHRDFDGLIVVNVSPETQLRRVLARGGLTEAEARARIAAQLPLAEKVAAATHVIDNDGAPEATRAQVEHLVAASIQPQGNRKHRSTSVAANGRGVSGETPHPEPTRVIAPDRDSVVAMLSTRQAELRSFGIASLSLFGAIARNEGQASSDVDLLVTFQEPVTSERFFDLKFFLEDLLGRRIDLVTEAGLSESIRRTIAPDLVRLV
jgi:dephospho-CoA kinase